MTGQSYGHVNLTMWKLSKKGLSPFWKNAHQLERLPLSCLLIYTDIYGVLASKKLCKIINQAVNSVNSDLPALSSVQATSLSIDLYPRRVKLFSRKLRNNGAKVHSVTEGLFHSAIYHCTKLKQIMDIWPYYEHYGHINISFSSKFAFTTSETMRDYYL